MATYTETYNFPDHPQGDTFLGIQFEYLINDVAIDLNGASVNHVFQGGLGYDYTLTVDNGIELTDPDSGILTIMQQVFDWVPDTYNHYQELRLASGEVYTFIEGTFTITKK